MKSGDGKPRQNPAPRAQPSGKNTEGPEGGGEVGVRIGRISDHVTGLGAKKKGREIPNSVERT